ncbi:MAG: hypothetical protein PHQ53_08440, partial [Candidatus Krumholzibacteria bacterium]|nr:hypothetical protein [Candidatus Krumholzibacteria bacterium]
SVPHSAELNFRGEVSYIHFLTEDYPGGDYSFSMIPILALAEYHLTDSPAYLLGGLGFVIGRSKVEFDNEDRSDTDTEIGLALGGGFALSPSLDLEGRLNLVSDANSISAHLRFRF